MVRIRVDVTLKVSYDFRMKNEHDKTNDLFASMQDRDGTVFMRQSGVFRTNCMDCLDRTNVVQSLIARISLEAQLKQLGIFRMNSTIESEVRR